MRRCGDIDDRLRPPNAGRPPALTAFALTALSLLCGASSAGVLPEDRADVLFHSYDGGGVTIQGPSVLVRKQIGRQFSVSGNYYVDSISSASIDVVTTASPYDEERTQYSVGVDYLHDRWTMNVGVTTSSENDFEANTYSFGISQDLFGDLTTVSLGYSVGDNAVGRTGDPDFAESSNRRNYRLGVSQILTRNLLLGLSAEKITDEGFLNNPYRSVRYLDSDSPVGYSYEPEAYPRTRTSDAASLRMRYHLPWRAALHWEYRTFADSWGIEADTYELGYTHPAFNGWTLETRVRAYAQTSADFYSDLFPNAQYQNFLARDKELSTFSSVAVRLGASYEILPSGWRFVERGSVSLFYDFIQFSYDDFRNLTVEGVVPGEEPLYGFDANVVQLFVSFWF